MNIPLDSDGEEEGGPSEFSSCLIIYDVFPMRMIYNVANWQIPN